jgi:hypothetical protein
MQAMLQFNSSKNSYNNNNNYNGNSSLQHYQNVKSMRINRANNNNSDNQNKLLLPSSFSVSHHSHDEEMAMDDDEMTKALEYKYGNLYEQHISPFQEVTIS